MGGEYVVHGTAGSFSEYPMPSSPVCRRQRLVYVMQSNTISCARRCFIETTTRAQQPCRATTMWKVRNTTACVHIGGSAYHLRLGTDGDHRYAAGLAQTASLPAQPSRRLHRGICQPRGRDPTGAFTYTIRWRCQQAC